MAETINK